jgi:hypothetical protein
MRPESTDYRGNESVRGLAPAALALLLSVAAPLAHAGDRLLATGGVMQIEGTAGGGLTPWALIAGLGTNRQTGVSGFCTRVEPDDFSLDVCGVAVGIRNRVELSFAQQRFDLGTTVPGESITQNIFGAKVRLLGDAVYDQDRWWPQVSLGMQYKKNEDFDFVPQLLGAQDDTGIDWYVSAAKVWLDGPLSRTVLAGLTLRATEANQLGLLGFGGDVDSGHELVAEGSLAMFLSDFVILGVEYRQKPDNLSVFREDDFSDVFVAFVPTKYLSITGAWVDLGNIADKADQKGWYLSLQASF